MTDLLNCPFCGSMPDVHEIEAHKHNMKLGEFTMPDHPGCFTLECPTPGCCGMIAETKAELVAAWERRAIAPPVAAGSVDTPALQSLFRAEQQRADRAEADLAEARKHARDNHEINIQLMAAEMKATERAEKAEAEVKQVNEWRAAALVSNQQMQELMVAKLAEAEARVAELETEIKVLHRG